MKKRDIFLATFEMDAENVIRKHGIGIEFNQFCISSTLFDVRRALACRAMQAQLDRLGLKAPYDTVCHGPFTEILPEAIDTEFVDLALKRMGQAVDGCKTLGVNRLVVHSGYYPTLYFRDWHRDKSVYFWSKLLEVCPEDFHVYLENVLDSEPTCLLEVVEKIDDPRLELCLDIGHAHCATEPKYTVYDWIKLWGKRIGHFHFHNNNGTGDQHNSIFKGTMFIPDVLACIDENCKDEATITVESRDCDATCGWLKANCDGSEGRSDYELEEEEASSTGWFDQSDDADNGLTNTIDKTE